MENIILGASIYAAHYQACLEYERTIKGDRRTAKPCLVSTSLMARWVAWCADNTTSEIDSAMKLCRKYGR